MGFWTSIAAGGSPNRQNVLNAFAGCGSFRELAGTLYREANWLVADQLGTPRMVVNKSGSLASVKRHDYLPFGEDLTAAGRGSGLGYGATDGARQKFTSKERDDETGLDYFLARYYSSKQGRFTSPDEFTGGPEELFDFGDAARGNPTFYADVDNPQSLNKYQYTYNNPTNLTDENGHCPPCAAAAAAAVIVTIEILSAPDTVQAPTRSRTEPRPLPESGDGIKTLLTNATVGVVGGPIVSKAGRGVLKFAFGEGTEVVERAMSNSELQATRDTGLVRGGREGEHFVTNSVSKSATRAQQRLALPTKPQVGVQLEVPKGIFSAARRLKLLKLAKGVELPGGGLERTATGKIPARVIRVRRLDKQ